MCIFLEFEKYSIPEDLIALSSYALPGLACFPQAPHLCEEDLEMFDPLPNLSPVKIPTRSGINFLLGLNLHLLFGIEEKNFFFKVSVSLIN